MWHSKIEAFLIVVEYPIYLPSNNRRMILALEAWLYGLFGSAHCVPLRRTIEAYISELTQALAITKNGITRLAAPPTPDLSKFKTDKKITDEEILKILEQPIGKTAGKNKNRKKKKKVCIYSVIDVSASFPS